MTTLKVITPDNLGKGITFNPASKQWEVNAESGLTCESINSLPVKPWKKGTTLLAKQEGECVQLSALDSIFQEVGVGIVANKTSAFTGETYDVTVTVSNTGEGKNELTNFAVQKPLLGNYEIKDVRTSTQGIDEVETVDELTYNLKGIASGGTFILRFSVKANDVGTYQFTATVNPNSALDSNAVNNTDTIILKANTKIDTTYVPSVDCPRITATELDSNTQLIALTPKQTRNGIPPSFVNKMSQGVNIFGNRPSLRGLRIRLDGVSTVLVQEAGSSTSDFLVEISNGALAYTFTSPDQSVSANNDFGWASSRYTFTNGVLEFTEGVLNATIYCRPAGQNCRWQAFNVRGASQPKNISLNATNIVGGKVTYKKNESVPRFETFSSNVIPSTLSFKAPTSSVTHNASEGVNQSVFSSKLIFTVKRGVSASFDYTKPKEWEYKSLPYTQGKLTITENRVTVAADATSTDSINSEYLQVIVED